MHACMHAHLNHVGDTLVGQRGLYLTRQVQTTSYFRTWSLYLRTGRDSYQMRRG